MPVSAVYWEVIVVFVVTTIVTAMLINEAANKIIAAIKEQDAGTD